MSAEISNFDRLQALLPELFQSNQLIGKSYLRSQLTNQTQVLLSMESVQESLLINDQEITLIPNMPPYFLGLINSRNRVFGLIDLAGFLGLSNQIIGNRKTYHTIVIRVSDRAFAEQEVLVGFVFSKVQGLTRVMPSQLQSSEHNLSEALTPYVQYCVQEQEEQKIELTPILNLQAIAQNLNLIQN